MNLINLSDGHIDILRNVVRRELQRLAAGGARGGEVVNYDQVAHLLTIYDQLGDVASKWNGKLPQWGCRPIPPDEAYRPIQVTPPTMGISVYLARDGNLKPVPPVD